MSFSYRKIYADLVTPDGEVLVLYLTWLDAWGLRQAAAAVERYGVDGTRSVWPARACPAPPAGGLNGEWAVDLALAPGVVRLAFDRAAPPWAPAGPPAHPALDWLVLTPRCRARATWPDGRVSEGLGYVDQVRLAAPPRRLGLARLEWGRAHPDDGAVVFVRAVDRAGRAWERVGPVPAARPALVAARVLHDGPALDRARFPGVWRRGLARVLAGPIHETRRVARLDGECRAVWEDVSFGEPATRGR